MDQLTLTVSEDRYALSQMRFPHKLWHLLATRSDAVLWGGGGRTVLLNSHVLDAYLISNDSIFKTRHMSSFIRQLNLYGFRKVTSHLQDPVCNASNPHLHEYAHDYFILGRPDLLPGIRRRSLSIHGVIHKRTKCSGGGGSAMALERARSRLRTALRRAAQQLSLERAPRVSCHRYLSKGGSDSEDSIGADTEAPPPPPPNAECPDPDILPEKVILIEDEDSSIGNSPVESIASLAAEVSLAACSHSTPELGAGAGADGGADSERRRDCAPPAFSHGWPDTSDEYRREWDALCEQLTVHGGGSGGDLKHLYYQISRTMDLLNS